MTADIRSTYDLRCVAFAATFNLFRLTTSINRSKPVTIATVYYELLQTATTFYQPLL